MKYNIVLLFHVVWSIQYLQLKYNLEQQMASSATFQGQQGIECFLLLLRSKHLQLFTELQHRLLLTINKNNY